MRTRMGIVLVLAMLGALAPAAHASPRHVRVPDLVKGTSSAEAAYEKAQRAGFKVRISTPFVLHGALRAVSQRPRAGRRVVRGSVVTLRLAVRFAGVGSPVSTGETAPMPDLVGVRVVEAHSVLARLPFVVETHLGSLPPSRRPHLLDNYVVVRQHPAPGEIWSRGRVVPSKFPGLKGFLPTPVVLTGMPAR